MNNISIFDFNTAVISRRRQGTPDDPYIDIQESQQIINNKAILSEIPDTFTKVQVSGQNITWIETTGVPSENQYQVDYNEALVLFHESRNGLTLSFSFKGTGAHYLNVKRVFVLTDENGDVVQTLADLSDDVNIGLNNAIVATNNAITATNNANNAYSSTKLIFKNPVANYNSILSTYPSPQLFWTVQTLDNSKYYRYDGSAWVYIQEIQLSQIDTKLSKSGDIMSGFLTLHANPTNSYHASSKIYTDTKLSKLGDTMTGNLNMAGNEIQLGGFKIKYNSNLNSLDIEF